MREALILEASHVYVYIYIYIYTYLYMYIKLRTRCYALPRWLKHAPIIV
jgi:hypothetical protein